MTASLIASVPAMGGLVMLVIQPEYLTITQTNRVRFVPLTLTLAYLTKTELVSIWQIKFDRQQKLISAFCM
jgi:hypothetical protein